jgi:hypothetical protein
VNERTEREAHTPVALKFMVLHYPAPTRVATENFLMSSCFIRNALTDVELHRGQKCLAESATPGRYAVRQTMRWREEQLR